MKSEGVIQFAYNLQPPDEDSCASEQVAQINAWRTIHRRLGLIGQDPQRYSGLGFGNLSARDPAQPSQFFISASQTGGLDELTEQDLVCITHCNLERFWVEARGTLPPSSETTTHAMIYASDPRICWVMHAHSPEIWHKAEQLGLPTTAPEVGYGSADMVNAVALLLAEHVSRPLVFATLGHEDGVFACGSNARDAGGLLVSYLARALA